MLLPYYLFTEALKICHLLDHKWLIYLHYMTKSCVAFSLCFKYCLLMLHQRGTEWYLSRVPVIGTNWLTCSDMVCADQHGWHLILAFYSFFSFKYVSPFASLLSPSSLLQCITSSQNASLPLPEKKILPTIVIDMNTIFIFYQLIFFSYFAAKVESDVNNNYYIPTPHTSN